MKKLALCSALVLCSPFVWAADQADFSGHWTGTGSMTNSKGTPATPCASIEIVLKQTAKSLVIESYHAQCGSMASDWGPSTMTLKDGKTYEDGEETGTLTGNVLTTSSIQDGVEYIFNLTLIPGTTPVLKSDYGDRNYIGRMDVIGDLKPAQ